MIPPPEKYRTAQASRLLDYKDKSLGYSSGPRLGLIH